MPVIGPGLATVTLRVPYPSSPWPPSCSRCSAH